MRRGRLEPSGSGYSVIAIDARSTRAILLLPNRSKKMDRPSALKAIP
jgi:hypothetical protein